jgi:hypothetical protein
MSICIEPDGLDPGLYAGEVYLVDPSLNPARISVELTAQSRWINWLYSLLIIVPALALALYGSQLDIPRDRTRGNQAIDGPGSVRTPWQF